MSSEIRTFKIRDAAVQEDELALGEFLRTVDVARIETTYAGDAWHILVMFEELRAADTAWYAGLDDAVLGRTGVHSVGGEVTVELVARQPDVLTSRTYTGT